MKKLFYRILFELGFWIPFDKYKSIYNHYDWILVIFKYKSDGFCTLPKVGEYFECNDEFILQHNDWVKMNPLWNPVYCHKLPNPPKKCKSNYHEVTKL